MNFNAENSLAKATKIYSGGKIMSSANGAGPAISAGCFACRAACIATIEFGPEAVAACELGCALIPGC